MGSVCREDGVLKIVRPGRYVEIHVKPVAAAEILKKYPRHSITRPDFFNYPLVVVKPEAILHLGKVFFVVPNHTVYKLVKAHKNKHQESPSRNRSLEDFVNKKVRNDDSPRKTDAGSTPKHLNCQRRHNDSPPSASCMWLSSLDQKHRVGAWPEVSIKNSSSILGLEYKPEKDSRMKVKSSNHEDRHAIDKTNRLRLEKKPVEDLKIRVRSSNHDDEEYQNVDKDITPEFLEMNDDDYYEFDFKCSSEAITLKSCVRKPDSIRKSHKLRVTFLLPSEDEH